MLEKSLECLAEFCYLGDKVNAGGGAETSSEVTARSVSNKCRELRPLLTVRGFFLSAENK